MIKIGRRAAGAWIGSGLLWLSIGCASAPPPSVDRAVEPNATPEVDDSTSGIGHADLLRECHEVARLAADGQHKPAVDLAAGLEAAGATCPPPALEAAAASQALLDRADELTRQGSDEWKAGDRVAAGLSFARALEVYSKYYWVQKLAADLLAESAIEERAARLMAAGRPLEALGALDEAAVLGSSIAKLAPRLGQLREEVVAAILADAQSAKDSGELERAAELAGAGLGAVAARSPAGAQLVELAIQLGLNLFSTGRLLQAKKIWSAGIAFDSGNATLVEYLDQVERRLRHLEEIKSDG